MSPVWQLQPVAVDGHPGSAQHVVPGNAVGSQGDDTDADAAVDDGS
jgi:hypothetical protein